MNSPLLSVVDSAVAVVLPLRKVLSLGHPRDLINVADVALSKAWLNQVGNGLHSAHLILSSVFR